MQTDPVATILPPHLPVRPGRDWLREGRPDAPSGPRIAGGPALRPGRVHEFCGPARRRLALLVAQDMTGPVLWIAPAHDRARLHGEALAGLLAPGRLLFARPPRSAELLWTMEEALRAGCVPLVVCELPAPPPLTPVRRLQLAAEGAAVAGDPRPSNGPRPSDAPRPLGLLLLPQEGGAPGVESRWHLAPAHGCAAESATATDEPPGPDGTAWRWTLERRRARMAPPAAWSLRQDPRTAAFTLTPRHAPAGV